MSDDPHHGASKIEASKGGGGGKWLIGALAAVVLVGGGYAAWQATQSGQNEDQFAINNEYADEYASDVTDRAAPLAQPSSGDNTIAEPASVAAPAPRARSRSSSTTAAASQPVPEATIGITPVNASSDQGMDQNEEVVIVTPPRGPVWTRVPTARRLSALYPARALEREREGEARLACIIQQSGRLACESVEQTPGGFGGAALRVANTLEHSPYRADGSSAAGTPVNLRVVFRMGDENPQRYASR